MSQANIKRNRWIVKMRDSGKTFRWIARQSESEGIDPKNIHKIYHRDKDKYGSPKKVAGKQSEVSNL